MGQRRALGAALTVAFALVLVNACTSQPSPPAAPPPLPRHLARLATGEVQTRNAAGDILPSRAGDNAVLRGYAAFADKPAPVGPAGERLTILTAKSEYRAGEEVRVIHVHEATLPGGELYVMGPKAIYGEYVDGALASPAAAAPLGPYDGAVLQSPGEDHNYEVSTYRLSPGEHTIEWRFATLSGPTVLRSNTLRVRIR